MLNADGLAYERLEGHRGCRRQDCPHSLLVSFPWWGGQARYHYDFYVHAVPKRVEVKRGVGYSIYSLEKVLAAARHWQDYVVACDRRFATLLAHYQQRVMDRTKVKFEVVL